MNGPHAARRRRLVRVGLLSILAVVLVGVLAFVAYHHPNNYAFFPKCHLHSLTGLHCPGCGLTRSVHSLLNGEFSQALAYNALWPLMLPIVAIALIRSLWSWAWGTPVERSKPTTRLFPRWTPYVLMALLVTFAIARNIPYHPFNLLAPHELTPPQ
jgi:Protein of unknown function (DUF2752)